MTAAVTTPVHSAAPSSSRYRPDIQGLRAIAVGLVLLYHAGAPFLKGGFVGVDVFFVISGFLITGMLLRQSLETGRIDLTDFYARRIRRILPAATAVLLVTVIATMLVLPRTRWGNVGQDVIGSALYYVNWTFASNTDYLNADAAVSPLQHFWTLAVEEQFYILWPLLLIGLLLVVDRLRTVGSLLQSPALEKIRIRRALELGVVLMVLPSLLWSIYWTASEPAQAYFVTTTRLWELGVGAAIAVFALYLERLPARIGYALQLLGLVCIASAGVLYSSETVFPGAAALLPTLGAAAVIVGGMSGRADTGVSKFLAVKPMRWVGDLSYSLYLWHWPLLVFAAYLVGGELRFWQGLVIVVAAILPAWLSFRFIETPFRTWGYVAADRWRAIKVGVALMLISVLAGVSIMLAVRLSGQQDELMPGAAVGAQALDDDSASGEVVDQVGPFTPLPEEAADDNPGLFDLGCHQEQSAAEVDPCVFGDAESDYVVVLVGDSHAAQWLPALAPLAESHGWRLETYSKSSCPLNGVGLSIDGVFYEECYQWGQKVLESLSERSDVDHAIVSASRYAVPEEVPDGIPAGELEEGYAQIWGQLSQSGLPMTVILDTPRTNIDVPECVAEHRDQLSLCAVGRDEALSASGHPQLKKAAASSELTTIDMTDSICPAQKCMPVIGSVLVYRDSNHITATYAETLSPHLEEALRDQSDLSFSDH